MSENNAKTPRSRNARACEACRSSKSRCIYKSQADICLRCEQNGNDCIVRTKARPMRTRETYVTFTTRRKQLRPLQTPYKRSEPRLRNRKLRDLPHSPPSNYVPRYCQRRSCSATLPQGFPWWRWFFRITELSRSKECIRPAMIEERNITLAYAEQLFESFAERLHISLSYKFLLWWPCVLSPAPRHSCFWPCSHLLRWETLSYIISWITNSGVHWAPRSVDFQYFHLACADERLVLTWFETSERWKAAVHSKAARRRMFERRWELSILLDIKLFSRPCFESAHCIC